MCRDSWERVLLKFIFQKNESKITINRRGVSKSLVGGEEFPNYTKKKPGLYKV